MLHQAIVSRVCLFQWPLVLINLLTILVTGDLAFTLYLTQRCWGWALRVLRDDVDWLHLVNLLLEWLNLSIENWLLLSIAKNSDILLVVVNHVVYQNLRLELLMLSRPATHCWSLTTILISIGIGSELEGVLGGKSVRGLRSVLILVFLRNITHKWVLGTTVVLMIVDSVLRVSSLHVWW